LGLVAAIALLGALTATAADPSASAQLDRYTHPDGSDYFALSLKPGVAVPAAEGRDVLVLFDTSASQTGDYRATALRVLRDVVAGLGPNDRVQLTAVDMNAVPLSKGFVPANSPDLAAAIGRLEGRTPLGASDMDKALSAAADSFGEAKGGRAVVYVGKGTSRANLITPQRFEELTKQLVEKRVPVSSYVIGPQPDRQLLGALAAQTGGVVVGESKDAKKDARANETTDSRAILGAVRGTVLWPTAVTWPAGMTEIYPKNTPPLRTDRESVVVGKYAGDQPLAVEYTIETSAGPQKLAFNIAPAKSDNRNNYLAQVVERAKADGGLTLPFTDRPSLAAARDDVLAGVLNRTELARQALLGGNLDGAEQIADDALRVNPNDKEAARIKAEVAKRRAGGPAAAPAAPVAVTPAAPIGPAGGPPELNLVGPGFVGGPDDGRAAQGFVNDMQAFKTVIQTEVTNAVNRARGKMGADPEGATQDLKLTREHVMQAPQLNPEVRDQLRNVIDAALREAARRTVEIEQRRQQQNENQAKAKEMQLLADNMDRKEQKLRQLLERFNSLMDEGRYRMAEEAAAAEALALAPNEPTAIAATLAARTTGYYQDQMQLRVMAQKGFVDAMYQVDKSHVPMPDEPPIVYPAAEVWRELTARRKEKYSSMDLKQRNPAEKRIEDALKSPTQLEFVETPLSDVIDYLKDYHGIEIQVDKKALDDVGIGTDTPVTKNLKGISLKSALRLLLKEMSLTYIIENEVLLITTPEEADSKLVTKVYPVADLVLPIRDPGFQGGFSGMGGGMGMGGMGMGGGMGGMGMGGMGGGMGGFGGGGMGRGMGGGMGGGFFNVPPGVLPRVPPGGFQAFAVKDDLTVAPKGKGAAPPIELENLSFALTVAPKGKGAAPAKAADPQPIQIEIAPNADPNQVWEKHLAANEVDPAAVRETVRRLMRDRKYDHVIGLINAALRHNQPQPWMYEALVLAMQAAERPAEDIERAVMSAVDMAQTPLDMMFIAIYLGKLGYHERALKVYQDLSKLDPSQPEPYVYGLDEAKRVNSLPGIQWATTGILSQAWSADQAEIWKNGLFTARATLEKLRAEKRTAEAAAYEKVLNEAVRRDIVVRVKWTGEADIDVSVEEPNGAVCSLRNPRSAGGGVMLGDASAQIGHELPEGCSEVYVCPKGFDGAYRLAIRRIWGKPTAGKVSVEVLTHFRSEQGKRIQKSVTLEKDEALVVFDLSGGRRTEPVPQEKAAVAAAAQLAIHQQVHRQVLGQQLAAAADPRAMADFLQDRAGPSGGGFGGGQVFAGGQVPFAFMRGGAVGYQPIIITLPEGANLMATAVISADRRYVRITCVPLFSSIKDVHVFNFSTGTDTNIGQGGTGGQGFFGGGGGGGGGGGQGVGF
jgi:hypothetical protein